MAEVGAHRGATGSLTAWMCLSGTLGVVGLLAPWFKPSVPGTHGNTWHAWDNELGLLALAGPIFGAVILLAERLDARLAPNRGAPARAGRYLLLPPVAGLAAAAYVCWHLPKDDVLQNCLRMIGCDEGTSSWINLPGATRGIQAGFWVVIVANVMTLCGVAALALAGPGREPGEVRSYPQHQGIARTGIPTPQVSTALRSARSLDSSVGVRTCVSDLCENYGLPARENICGVCSAPTEPLNSPAPSVAADQPPRQSGAPARDGELCCPNPTCDDGGLRTSLPTCPICGTTTTSWR
jgi:hypothetical protein